jgi:hypothetical protein
LRKESFGAERVTILGSLGKPSVLREIFLVLAVAFAARLCFILVVPAGARSVDAFSWETVAGMLEAGKNPYQATSFLNWPPLWTQLVFCLSKIATAFNVPFFRVLQVFLIAVESLVLVLAIRLIKSVAPTARVLGIVIIGLAVNPIAVLLVCQHCNFDVIVALWLLLFLCSLVRYNRLKAPSDWLSACLFLGLGILTKTVPLILIPLLAGGFRQVTNHLKFLGGVLLLGPVTLGMSIIYVLAPADVTSKVLFYRSQEGFFGFHGLMCMAGVGDYLKLYNVLFYLLLLAVMILSWNFFWRRQLEDRDTILYTALVMAGIPVLGPGYATQYIYWFMPLLVATFAFYDRPWRIVLSVFAVVAASTYIVEYAFLPEFGYNLFYLWPSSMSSGANDALISMYYRLDSEVGRTLLRLPIFMAYLVLLISGVRILVAGVTNPGERSARTGSFSAMIYPPLAIVLGVILVAFGIWAREESKPDSGTSDSHIYMDRKTNKRWATGALNNLAWKLATSSDQNFRNGALAVKGAERACRETNYQVTTMVGTLAAAYAEADRFDEAITIGEKACQLASESAETNLLRVNKELVGLYQAHQPYHEPPQSLIGAPGH